MAPHLILIVLVITRVQSLISGTFKPISNNDNAVPKIADSLTLCCQSSESREHCDWGYGPQKTNQVNCKLDLSSPTNDSYSPQTAILNNIRIDANFKLNECTIRLSNVSSPSNGSGWDCRLSWKGIIRRKDSIKRITKLEAVTTQMPLFILGSTFHAKVVNPNKIQGDEGSPYLDTGKMRTCCTALRNLNFIRMIYILGPKINLRASSYYRC